MIVPQYRNKYKFQKKWYNWNKILPIEITLENTIIDLQNYDAFSNLKLEKNYLYTSSVSTQHGLLEYQVLFYDTEIKKFIRLESPWKIGLKSNAEQT